MKLYDIVAADGEFVESLTQREIMNKFGLTKCRFRTFLDNSYLIDGKYWIDDSAEDMQVTRNGCRKMLKQFDALTENISRKRKHSFHIQINNLICSHSLSRTARKS